MISGSTIVGDFAENEMFVTDIQAGDVVTYPGVIKFGGDPYNVSMTSYPSLITLMKAANPTAQLACISWCKNNAYRSNRLLPPSTGWNSSPHLKPPDTESGRCGHSVAQSGAVLWVSRVSTASSLYSKTGGLP